jgi:molybdate/tungstate transport system substrate-binding protein
MKKAVLGIIALAVMVALLIGSGCASPPSLIILHAGSLSVPLDKMSEEFIKQNPGVTINTESAGSRTTIRKVTELGKPCDIIGSADYMAIEELMFPDFADWYICFGRNQMVIAYGDGAPFAEDIVSGTSTWYDVLRNEDVTFGHSDPDADPCGYRTLMTIQLAQKYYYDEAGDFGLTPDDNAADLYDTLIAIPEGGTEMDRGRIGGDWGEVVKPKSVDLLYLLESGDLDYAFEYLSVAQQHEFSYIELPTEIDLSNMEFEDLYAAAQVEVTGSEPGTTTMLSGASIVYGLTIPTNAPNQELALDFVEFILGSEGQQIMEDCGQPPIVPAVASDPEKVPQELWDYITHP